MMISKQKDERRQDLFSICTLLCAMMLFFGTASCNSEKNNSTGQHPAVSHKAEQISKKSLIEQNWQDIRDSSHRVTLHKGYWYDLYNTDTASANPYILYADFPDKGGRPSDQGNIVQMEESPGNFYDFRIVELDSQRLRLELVAAEIEYSFIKISGPVSSEK